MEYAFKVYTVGFICLLRQVAIMYRYNSGSAAAASGGGFSPAVCIIFALAVASLQLLHYCYMLILDPAGLETTSTVSSAGSWICFPRARALDLGEMKITGQAVHVKPDVTAT